MPGASRHAELDNPIWHALGSVHSTLCVSQGSARRYLPDISPLAAVARPDRPSLVDLRALAETGSSVGLLADGPVETGPEWTTLKARFIDQMVCVRFQPAPAIPHETLTEADVPAMIALTAATQPGPFANGTIRMGHYIGVKQAGRLAAMSGERMKLPDLTEISAVCTDPDFRGQGLAAGLMSTLIQDVIQAGKQAFLHVKTENAGAIRVYERLGFERRREVWFMVLKAN